MATTGEFSPSVVTGNRPRLTQTDFNVYYGKKVRLAVILKKKKKKSERKKVI